MKILITGQKWFGAEVFRAISAGGVAEICAVCAPYGDRLWAAADRAGLQLIPAGALNAETIPKGIDLIVAAHSHDFVGEKTRFRAKWGGIGYHPSLLPLHRGRDAVRWAIRMGDKITGGSVYRLSNKVDGGNILAQAHVFIRPGDTPEELWRRELAPLGVEMLAEAVGVFARYGFQAGTPQDDALATWEPSIGRPPVSRPDLEMICCAGALIKKRHGLGEIGEDNAEG